MQYALMALQILPLIIQLIGEAEQLFSGSGHGAEKKDHAMKALTLATDAAIAAGAPLTADGRDQVLTALSTAVDSTVATINIFTAAATPPGPGPA